MKKAPLLLRVYELGVSLKAQTRKTRRAMRRMKGKNEGLVRKNVFRCLDIMEAKEATLVEKHAAQVAALVEEQDAQVAALVRKNTQRIKIMQGKNEVLVKTHAAQVAAVSGERDAVFAVLKSVLAERGG
jgi:hypothetical protein